MFDIQQFSDEETPVNEIIDGDDSPKDFDFKSEINSAISKAIADFKKQLDAANKEQAKLEKMSDEERKQSELENIRAELESQRAEFEREKIKYEASKVLAQRNLPVEFTEYLIDVDNEKTLARITTFEKKYHKAIENAVNERLKGKPPVAGNSTDNVKPNSNSLAEMIRKNQARR